MALLTRSATVDLLRRHGLRPRTNLGQHFLVDPNTVRRILRLAGVGPEETILEIGPGIGSLTVALAQSARRVVTIEIDAQVIEALKEVVGPAGNVEIVAADALRADLSSALGEPARLVANLPYNVATPILVRLLDEVDEITGGLVMVQRELGERWTASPGTRSYGSVTVHVDYHAEARIAGTVPATVFMPPPDVESVLVEFKRRTTPPVDVDDPAGLFRFVRSAFGHRRKTLRNSLAAGGFGTGAVEEALSACGLDPRARPEALSLADFARLYVVLAA